MMLKPRPRSKTKLNEIDLARVCNVSKETKYVRECNEKNNITILGDYKNYSMCSRAVVFLFF